MTHEWNDAAETARRINIDLVKGEVTPNQAREHMQGEVRPHSHYFKDVSKFQFIDVYRVLQLFNVTDPCLQHAVKKLLVAGGRGAGKPIGRDVQEAIDTLNRWVEMRYEDIAENGSN